MAARTSAILYKRCLCVVLKCFHIPAWEPRVIHPSAAFIPPGSCQSALTLRVCLWVLVLSGNKQLRWPFKSAGFFSWDDRFEIHPYVSTSLQITLIYFLFFCFLWGRAISMRVCGSQDSLKETVPSSQAGAGDWTEVFRLDAKRLRVLTQFAGPTLFLFSDWIKFHYKKKYIFFASAGISFFSEHSSPRCIYPHEWLLHHCILKINCPLQADVLSENLEGSLWDQESFGKTASLR